MSLQEFLSDLKSWQQGAAAIVAFGGLIFAALFNAHLNRKRDERLRQEEVRSVAAASTPRCACYECEPARLRTGVSADGRGLYISVAGAPKQR